MQTFREYLDELCRTHNVAYSDLARRIGVTKSYVGQLIHGHSKPAPRRRVEQIADALGLEPRERQRLVDLAVRERARSEARAKIEELDSAVSTLRSTTGELLVSILTNLVQDPQGLPDPVARAIAGDDVLARLHAALSLEDPAQAVDEQLRSISPARLAAALNALTRAAGPSAARAIEGSAAPLPPRPDIPVIGYVAAGETDIAFTDAGLPVGAGLPGEEPIPRWPGVGEHAYALRITGESMMPMCPPGTTVVVDPDRTPRNGELAICQTTEGKTYFKIVQLESAGAVRLISTNQAVAPDIVLPRSHVRRLQKVVATLYA